MAKNASKYPHVTIEKSPVFRLRPGSGPFKSLEEYGAAHERVGLVEMANGQIIGELRPFWQERVAPLTPNRCFDSTALAGLDDLLRNYRWERASELAQVPWSDMLEAAQKISDAADKLRAAVTVSNKAQEFVVNRLAAAEPFRFSSDTYYPQITQLAAHSARVLKELQELRANGGALPVVAWRNFVKRAARIYLDLGGDITVSKLSRANPSAKPSPFAEFAHALMLEVPSELRQHAPGGIGSINTFSDALSGEVSELQKLERFPPKWKPVRRKKARQNKKLEP